ARLTHATAAVAALKRGARLIMVDPRRVGLANRADLWLRVRPGSDGALALGIAGVMIERGWYDRAFVRDWTNGPLLVRSDDGRLLTEADLTATGSVQRYVAWDTTLQRPLVYDPARRRYARDGAEPALFGEYKLDTPRGALACRLAFDLIAENCRRFSPDVVAATCWIEREQVERAARTQWVTTAELYRAILDEQPYAVRGLVGFGANLLVAHADVTRGCAALAALDFYVHADVFMNPTAELADVVLPVATPFEREALKLGFEVSPAAQSLVQLRRPVVAPRGEARSDTEIVFELARRLGLGAHFWNGDIDAAYRHQLAPSGLSLDTLRANPAGVRVPLQTRYRKYAEETDGVPTGFATPTRKIELYCEAFLN